MGKIIFVTGSDTGVGKTVVTALLVHHLRQSGVKALAIKPFCSGSRADTRLLRDIQGRELTSEEVTPFYFRRPLAPGVQRWEGEGKRPDLARTIDFIEGIRGRSDVLLVEGCGGLRVPLGPGWMVDDLIKALKTGVIAVCANRLGAINQTLLTLEALERLGVTKTTVIFNEIFAGNREVKRTNEEFLRKAMGVKPLISLGFMGDLGDGVEGIKKHHKKFEKVLAGKRWCE